MHHERAATSSPVLNPQRAPRRRQVQRRRAITLAACLALMTSLAWQPSAAAQGAGGFSGTYVLMTEAGAIQLTLQQVNSAVNGYLDLGGNRYELSGQVDDAGLFGAIWTGQEELYFEAELQGTSLYMIMAQLDPRTGAPDPATAGEYLFQRASAAQPPPATQQPPTVPPARSAAPPAANPAGAQAAMPQNPQGAQGPPPGMQQAVVGRRYEAGSVVGSADAGAAFVVPPAYYAGYHPQENVFMLISDTQPGLVVVQALSHMNLQSAVAQLGQSFQAGNDTTVQPQGQPQVTGNVARASFLVLSPNGALPLYVMGASGAAGNVLIVAGLGGPTEQNAIQQLVERIQAGATLFAPSRASATAAAAQLAGAQLWRSSSHSGTGVSDGVVDDSSIQLDLCSDGSYAYTASANVGVSVYGTDGGGASLLSRSSEEEHGRWAVESGLLGPVLVLQAATGGVETFLELLEAGGTLYVDGLPVATGRSARCA